MRLVRSLLFAAFLLALVAAPAAGAEELTMECPVCDHVDVAGRGLEPNATLTLVITDTRTGQDVLWNPGHRRQLGQLLPRVRHGPGQASRAGGQPL
jgi:hypothetical protein